MFSTLTTNCVNMGTDWSHTGSHVLGPRGEVETALHSWDGTSSQLVKASKRATCKKKKARLMVTLNGTMKQKRKTKAIAETRLRIARTFVSKNCLLVM